MQVVFQDGTSGEKYACYQADYLLNQCQRLNMDVSWWAGKPNAITIPRGIGPSYGYILLTRKELDAIDTDAYDHKLLFIDDIQTVTVEKLCIVDCRCIAPAKAATVATNIFLVRLSDARHLIYNTVVEQNYNILSHDLDASGNPQYYETTINGSYPYTWAEILQDLWSYLPSAIFDSFPTIDGNAIAPSSTVKLENLFYSGCSAWWAINDLLSLTGHTIRYTPEGECKIVAMDVTTEDDALLLTHEDRLIDTVHGISCIGANRYPATVKIGFPLRDGQYQEQDTSDEKYVTPQDLFYEKSGYTESITSTSINASLTPIDGTNVSLSTPLYSAKYWLNPTSGIKEFLNETEIETFAEFLATRYLNYLYGYTLIENTYSGFSYLYPGSLLAYVYYGDAGSNPITFASSIPPSENPFLPPEEGMGGSSLIPNTPTSLHVPGPSRHYSEEVKSHIPYHKQTFIKVNVDIDPGDQGSANLLRGSVLNEEWSWENLSPVVQTTVVNATESALVTGADKYPAYWDHQMGKFVVSSRLSSSGCTIVFATVNEASGVNNTDADFDVDNVEVMVGEYGNTTISGVRNGQSLADRRVFCDDAPVLLIYNDQESAWDVLWNGTARNLRATISTVGGVSGGNFDVENIVEKDGYWKDTSTSGSAISNPFDMEGDYGGIVWLFVCDDGTLECIQMECPA